MLKKLAGAAGIAVLAAMMASSALAQAPDTTVTEAGPFLQFVIQYVLPALGTLLAAAVTWLVWFIKQKTGLQIEAQYRDAFQKALEQAAGGLLNKLGQRATNVTLDVHNPAVAAAINYVLKSAPDAVKKFGLEDKPREIAEKLANKVGVMTAGPPAVSIEPAAGAASASGGRGGGPN